MDPTTTPPPSAGTTPPPSAGTPLQDLEARHRWRYARAIRIYDAVKRPGHRVLTIPEIQRVLDADGAARRVDAVVRAGESLGMAAAGAASSFTGRSVQAAIKDEERRARERWAAQTGWSPADRRPLSEFVPHEELGLGYMALAVLATLVDPIVRFVERLVEIVRRALVFLRWLAGIGADKNRGRS